MENEFKGLNTDIARKKQTQKRIYLFLQDFTMVKRCTYGVCNSDSRKADKPHMEGVFFIPFPKPKSELGK